MAVMMVMEWDGVTKDEYEQARTLVDWEGNVPDGAMLHVAAVADGALHVTDVWESAEQFQRFAETRLMPAVQQIGIVGEPRTAIYPLQGLFAPNIGATATR